MSGSVESGGRAEGRSLALGAYLACGGIAVGSVGPWGAEFFGYDGIGNSGSLTLLAAGLAAFAVWRWTISLRRSAAIATLALGAACVAIAVHDMLGIRGSFDSSNELAWIEGVGWGLGLVLLSGIVLVLLSISLYGRGRAARPSLNWKQRALIIGVGAAFLVGLGSVASDEPDRLEAEILVLEGSGNRPDARDRDDVVLALQPGTLAETVMKRLGPPVSVFAHPDESTLYYDAWQLTFANEGLKDRIRYPVPEPEFSVWAFDRRQRVLDRKIRNLRLGTSIEAVKDRLGQPEAVEVYGRSLRRDVGLWYGERRLVFDGDEFDGAYR